MKELRQAVNKLATEELERANKKFPLFNSAHEGFSVLLEEIDEVKECLDYINERMNSLWQGVKRNADSKTLNMYAEGIRISAINLSAEAIQVSAMASKFIDSMDKNKGED